MSLPKPVKTLHYARRWVVLFLLITLSAVALGLKKYFSDKAESEEIEEKINPDETESP